MSVGWPEDTVESKITVHCQPFLNATVAGEYLGHECPGYSRAQEKSELPGESSPFSGGGRGTFRCVDQAALRCSPMVPAMIRLMFEPGPPRGG